MIHFPIFLQTPEGFISPSRIFVEFFSKLYILPWKNFKFMAFKLLENASKNELKNWIYSFSPMPLCKTLPQVFIINPLYRGKLLIFSRQDILKTEPFCSRGEETIRDLKKWPKLNLQGYWSQVLINPTIFVLFTFLVTALLYHNLDSSMLKC